VFPAWLATMEQVPGARTVTVVPATVQMGSVADAKPTGRPEVETAPIEIGATGRLRC